MIPVIILTCARTLSPVLSWTAGPVSPLRSWRTPNSGWGQQYQYQTSSFMIFCFDLLWVSIIPLFSHLFQRLKILNISLVSYFLRISAEEEQYTTSNHRGKGSTWLILIPTHKSNQIIILISGQDGRDARSCEQFAGEPEREKSRAVI